ncbi:MAG TPA: glycosyltransferase [Thermoleophilaceae bacterium]
MGRDSPRLVSVVLAVRNHAGPLTDQLAALAAQDYEADWELVVADNGSTDGSRAVAHDFFEGGGVQGRIVDVSARRGAGAARNGGAAAALGDLLAFCDADNVARPGWLRGLAEAAPDADLMVGASLLDRLNSPDHAAWMGNPAGDRAPVGLGFMPFANAGNCAYWADAFEALGGFDLEFEGGEDMDLSWRAQLAGYRLAFAPGAEMDRRCRDRLGALTRQHWSWGRASGRLIRSYRIRGMDHGARAEAGYVSGGLRRLPRAALSRADRGRWLAQAALASGRWFELVSSGLRSRASGAPAPPPAGARGPAGGAPGTGRTGP